MIQDESTALQTLLDRADRAKAISNKIGVLSDYGDNRQRQQVTVTLPYQLERDHREKRFPGEVEVFELIEAGRQALLGKLQLELKEVLGQNHTGVRSMPEPTIRREFS